MNVEVMAVPYDSGHRSVRMGRGPVHLLDYGILDALRADGHEVRLTEIDCALDPPTEIALAFDLARSLADAVRDATASGRFPVGLAGNCFSSLGTVAGLGPERTGVLWFDAHADLNTSETTRSGLLDGMAAATLTGRCWRELAATVPGYAKLPDRRLAMIGVRDLDPYEATVLAAAEIEHVRVGDVRHGARAALAPVLSGMGDPDTLYLHVDLDVLDPGVARANGFAADGGLTVDDVLALAAAAASACRIGAAAITAFDPAYDDDDAAGAAAAVTIVRGILERTERT